MKSILLVDRHFGIENSRGGIYNSSIFQYQNYFYVIGRCESIPESERSEQTLKEHCAILFKLDSNFKIISYKKLKFLTHYLKYRIEDFRVFSFRGKIYVNHTFIKIFPNKKTTQVISELNLEQGTLQPIEIKLDFEVQDIEKNWLFFEHHGKLKLIYSLSPFILLSSDDGIHFTTEKREIGIKSDGGFFLSGSTNPIELDNYNYLAFYHYRDSERKYHHVPFFLDKKTLTIASRCKSNTPLFSGGNAKGDRKNVIYLMSHIKNEDEIIFSFGEGDSVTTLLKMKTNDILSAYT